MILLHTKLFVKNRVTTTNGFINIIYSDPNQKYENITLFTYSDTKYSDLSLTF